MATSTNSRKPRQRNPLPAVNGTVRILTPVCTESGAIEINGKAYECRCLRHGYRLLSFDERRHEERLYDLPADLASCDCPEWMSRHDLRADGKCKHQKALAALLAAGKLPKVEADPIQHNGFEDGEFAA